MNTIKDSDNSNTIEITWFNENSPSPINYCTRCNARCLGEIPGGVCNTCIMLEEQRIEYETRIANGEKIVDLWDI